MSRNSAAYELQNLITEIDGRAIRAERLAEASGGLVNALWFRAAQRNMQMAAGDLDSKGLLLPEREEQA